MKKFSPKRFHALVDASYAEVRKLIAIKGGEYSGTEDSLANFRRAALNSGVNKETALFIYMSKHYDSIATYVRDLQTGETRPRSESMKGRVHDLIVYLLLFEAMLEEGPDSDA